MFTTLDDGWGWFDLLDSCSWEELKTRDFVGEDGQIAFSVKIELPGTKKKK